MMICMVTKTYNYTIPILKILALIAMQQESLVRARKMQKLHKQQALVYNLLFHSSKLKIFFTFCTRTLY